MKQKLTKVFPLVLAGALQIMPLARQALPALAAAGNSPAWAIVLKLAAGAVALLGTCHTVSAASSISISPTNATVGVKFSGFVQYTGGHSGSVQSWQLTSNWKGAQTVCSSPYQIAPGIFLTNAANALVTVSGIATQAGTFSFTMKIWSATSCSGGDSDVRTASITIAPGSSAPILTAPPANQLVTVGSNATFTATASGTPAPGYFWQSNGVNVANGATLTLNSVQLSYAATYRVVATNASGAASNSAALTVIAPPVNQTNLAGSTATFTVDGNSTLPLNFQWQTNSVNLVGQTNATLALANVQLTNAGTYTVIVSNSVAAATYSATLTVLSPPVFFSGLNNVTTNVGGSAIFAKGASGTAPIGYQWFLNGVLRGINPGIVLTNLQVADSGTVIEIATNAYGSATNFATLTVISPTTQPVITNQPASLIVPQTSNATFTVVAGGGALAYQWLLNTSTPVGANTSMLALNNAAPTDSGFYTVVITNASGSVTSAPAQLLVVPPPAATNSPALELPPSTNGQFALTFNLEPGFRYLVQGSDDLSSTNWLTLTNLPPSFSSGTFTFSDPSSNAFRFYRAIVQQQ